MTTRGMKRFYERRLSTRRSDSDSSATDQSCHGATGYRRSYLRNSSVLSSFNSVTSAVAIDPGTRDLTVRAVEERKDSFRESIPPSLIQAHDARDCIAPFQMEEIQFGPKLGAGEFSNVYEVRSFKYEPDFAQDAKLSVEELNKRLHMKTYERYRETRNARYALKHIKEDYHKNKGSESYIQAASDLALEGEFLASLQHPNIIKLRGISHAGAAGFEQGPSGYFLIIDRLVETLDVRMRRWRGPSRRGRMSSLSRSFTIAFPVGNSSSKPSTRSPKEEENGPMDERYNIALQIAAAMKYLHSHSIMFRDLKPTNIGFDVRGDVKIFDLGLARIMPESIDSTTEVYDMSGAGSPRYMAPECLDGEAYNLKADVYSFAVVLWEILSGRTPYAYVKGIPLLIIQVVDEKVRPVIDESWPSPIQGMLESSFDSEINKRPNMELWSSVIRNVLASLRGGDIKDLSESHLCRRRSLDSMADPPKGLERPIKE